MSVVVVFVLFVAHLYLFIQFGLSMFKKSAAGGLKYGH